MGILKRAADLGYTFRFIRMMVMDWKDWDAYKQGIIDENGKRNKNVKLDTDEKKSAYTPFIRLAANIKRLVAKIPGGGTKLGSFASALYLIKEKVGTKGLEKICKELERRYDIKIQFQDNLQKNTTISGIIDLSPNNLDSVLSSISLLSKRKFKLQGDSYILL